MYHQIFNPAAPIFVRKRMTYAGINYRPGDFFPADQVGCPPRRLKTLFEQRYLYHDMEKARKLLDSYRLEDIVAKPKKEKPPKKEPPAPKVEIQWANPVEKKEEQELPGGDFIPAGTKKDEWELKGGLLNWWKIVNKNTGEVLNGRSYRRQEAEEVFAAL